MGKKKPRLPSEAANIPEAVNIEEFYDALTKLSVEAQSEFLGKNEATLESILTNPDLNETTIKIILALPDAFLLESFQNTLRLHHICSRILESKNPPEQKFAPIIKKGLELIADSSEETEAFDKVYLPLLDEEYAAFLESLLDSWRPSGALWYHVHTTYCQNPLLRDRWSKFMPPNFNLEEFQLRKSHSLQSAIASPLSSPPREQSAIASPLSSPPREPSARADEVSVNLSLSPQAQVSSPLPSTLTKPIVEEPEKPRTSPHVPPLTSASRSHSSFEDLYEEEKGTPSPQIKPIQTPPLPSSIFPNLPTPANKPEETPASLAAESLPYVNQTTLPPVIIASEKTSEKTLTSSLPKTAAATSSQTRFPIPTTTSKPFPWAKTLGGVLLVAFLVAGITAALIFTGVVTLPLAFAALGLAYGGLIFTSVIFGAIVIAGMGAAGLKAWYSAHKQDEKKLPAERTTPNESPMQGLNSTLDSQRKEPLQAPYFPGVTLASSAVPSGDGIPRTSQQPRRYS